MAHKQIIAYRLFSPDTRLYHATKLSMIARKAGINVRKLYAHKWKRKFEIPERDLRIQKIIIELPSHSDGFRRKTYIRGGCGNKIAIGERCYSHDFLGEVFYGTLHSIEKGCIFIKEEKTNTNVLAENEALIYKA